MRQVRLRIPLSFQPPSQRTHAGPAAVGPPFVVGDHLPHRGMRFEQRRRDRRRDDVDGTMLRGKRGQKRGREHHVAEKGGLNDKGRHGVRESYARLPRSAPGAAKNSLEYPETGPVVPLPRCTNWTMPSPMLGRSSNRPPRNGICTSKSVAKTWARFLTSGLVVAPP